MIALQAIIFHKQSITVFSQCSLKVHNKCQVFVFPFITQEPLVEAAHVEAFFSVRDIFSTGVFPSFSQLIFADG